MFERSAAGCNRGANRLVLHILFYAGIGFAAQPGPRHCKTSPITVHTNGIENFWSLLRRTLGGTYVSVEPIHLQAYIHEQVYRFNLRSRSDEKITNADRFALALSNIGGQRLTWKELTGKEEGAQPF